MQEAVHRGPVCREKRLRFSREALSQVRFSQVQFSREAHSRVQLSREAPGGREANRLLQEMRGRAFLRYW